MADINPLIALETINIEPPYTLESLFKTFGKDLKKVLSSPKYVGLTEQGKRPKIVVIVDALSSNPALLMPWERVVEYCKGYENVWTLVDAAHAVGQIVGINLNKTQPDFWISVSSVSVIRMTEAEQPWSNRTATSGCTQNALARFFTFREGKSTTQILASQK